MRIDYKLRSHDNFHDKLLTRTYRDETGDNNVPNVLSPRDLVFRPDLRT